MGVPLPQPSNYNPINSAERNASLADKILRTDELSRDAKSNIPDYAVAHLLAKLETYYDSLVNWLIEAHFDDTGEIIDEKMVLHMFGAPRKLRQFHARLIEIFVSVRGFSISKIVEMNAAHGRIEIGGGISSGLPSATPVSDEEPPPEKPGVMKRLFQ